MATITFDTLKFVETLKASGFDEPQARGMAVAIQEAHANQFEDMAAKRDLKALEGQLSTKADMAKVEVQILELKRDIKELELRIAAEIAPLKWGMMVCVGGIIALILKSFFPH